MWEFVSLYSAVLQYRLWTMRKDVWGSNTNVHNADVTVYHIPESSGVNLACQSSKAGVDWRRSHQQGLFLRDLKKVFTQLCEFSSHFKFLFPFMLFQLSLGYIFFVKKKLRTPTDRERLAQGV